eukprot:TRINITY_DN39856_c0_g1_i1.p1 TRINITY_DN39856_c0_g1~~TRINITY_DN39856_c0_g1_i1.p1  ORF type:complete len:661 (-),score=122.89 TRINITY_DN39856_c0_g1_i1:81-2063(-)
MAIESTEGASENVSPARRSGSPSLERRSPDHHYHVKRWQKAARMGFAQTALQKKRPSAMIQAQSQVRARKASQWQPPTAKGIIEDDEFASDAQATSRGGFMALWSARLLQNTYFDSFATGVICLNGIVIGWELQLQVYGEDSSILGYLDSCFLAFYIFELSLWFMALGVVCLKNNWVKVDCFFVFFGIVDSWILTPVLNEGGAANNQVGILRLFRLFRLARGVRLLYKSAELFTLVNGIVNSLGTMVYVMILLFVILYGFSCLGIEFISNNELVKTDAEFKAIVDNSFSDLWITMLTLLQFIAMDSVAAVYTPLIKKAWWLSFYFISVIVLVFVVLMNLVTAVIVESALARSNQNIEVRRAMESEQKAKYVSELYTLCLEIDSDQSGKISSEELKSCTEMTTFIRLQELLKVTSPEAVLHFLDIQDNDDVDIDDFCSGLLELVMFEGPKELKRLDRVSNKMRNRLESLEIRMIEMSAMMSKLVNNEKKLAENLDSYANAGSSKQPKKVGTAGFGFAAEASSKRHVKFDSDDEHPPDTVHRNEIQEGRGNNFAATGLAAAAEPSLAEGSGEMRGEAAAAEQGAATWALQSVAAYHTGVASTATVQGENQPHVRAGTTQTAKRKRGKMKKIKDYRGSAQALVSEEFPDEPSAPPEHEQGRSL